MKTSSTPLLTPEKKARPKRSTMAGEVSRPSVMALNTITSTMNRWKIMLSRTTLIRSRTELSNLMVPPTPRPISLTT